MPDPPLVSQSVYFGVFEADLHSGELRKHGLKVKIQEQPFRVLAMLLEQPGQIVTREELRKKLWPADTFVDFEHGLNAAINKLRRALGDPADNPRFVETLHRRGYRFIAPVVGADGGAYAVAPMPSSAISVAAMSPSPTPVAAMSPSLGETAVRDRRYSRRWKILVPAAVILVAAAIGGTLYFRSRQAMTRLTDKDTIVLSDFDNKTGDAVFDDTLKQGLSVQLEQSPFLALLSERSVNDTLKLMGRSPGDRLTPEVTREVCQRTGSTTMVTGSIAGLGSQYVIGLKALNCNTGDVLAEAQEQAAGKEAVLKALDAAAVSLRGKLGESLSTVQKYATPLEEATTPSLEALKAYSLGEKTYSAKGDIAALPFFQRAVDLDPNLAMAYALMSSVYWDLNEVGRAAENARKAYDLREKVSERERLWIEGNYYLTATRELGKAAQAYELWQQTYPRDPTPYRGLGLTAIALGNLEKALEEFREAMRLEPNDASNYICLGYAYTTLNRLDE